MARLTLVEVSTVLLQQPELRAIHNKVTGTEWQILVYRVRDMMVQYGETGFMAEPESLVTIEDGQEEWTYKPQFLGPPQQNS